jgi:hypothetical protein
MGARRAIALTVAVAISWLGCEEEPPPRRLPKSADPPAPTLSATTVPRERTYYVANLGESCVVFWEEGLRTSKRAEVPCPREIEAGERLRLVGRTCMRESNDPKRSVPARCPKHIFYAELHDEQGKGEFKLAPQK